MLKLDVSLPRLVPAAELAQGLERQGYLVLEPPDPANPDRRRGVDWTQTRAYAMGFGQLHVHHASGGGPVKLITPKLGAKAKIVEMCAKNARLLLQELQLQKMKAKQLLIGG